MEKAHWLYTALLTSLLVEDQKVASISKREHLKNEDLVIFLLEGKHDLFLGRLPPINEDLFSFLPLLLLNPKSLQKQASKNPLHLLFVKIVDWLFQSKEWPALYETLCTQMNLLKGTTLFEAWKAVEADALPDLSPLPLLGQQLMVLIYLIRKIKTDKKEKTKEELDQGLKDKTGRKAQLHALLKPILKQGQMDPAMIGPLGVLAMVLCNKPLCKEEKKENLNALFAHSEGKLKLSRFHPGDCEVIYKQTF